MMDAMLMDGGEPMSPVPVEAGPAPAMPGLSVLVTSVSSDSHTWNLVYLQLALEELGYQVRNLGACVPDDLVVAECLRGRHDLVVVSTVNGHGSIDGARLIRRIRACPELANTPVVIGGKLGIDGPGGQRRRDELTAAGFDAVFEEGTGMAALQTFAEQRTLSVHP
jgi:methylaspartate mutase sigma subunit